MRSIVQTYVGAIGILLLVISVGVLPMAPSAHAGAQGVRVFCLDDPSLSTFDKDGDKAITKAELDAAAKNAPANKDLQDLKDRVKDDDFTEVQYTGQCHAEGEPGESAVVVSEGSASGELGESATGGDGGSVSVTTSQSVMGEDGQSALATIRQQSGPDEQNVVDGKVVCAPSPQLAMIDSNDNGVVSIEEIDGLIDLVGGNEDLESVRDEAVSEGIIGIQYRDCVPGTPDATPISATPAATPLATPERNATPSASGVEPIEGDGAGAERAKSHFRALLFAGAGGAGVVAVAPTAHEMLKA